jgi:serine-type D-Ala-D-Ala endopeptidase (penicillin-binding protein 7)
MFELILASALDASGLNRTAGVQQMPTHGTGETAKKFSIVPPCTMKFCCYNADTSCNTLIFKGLPVTRARLFRIARLICFLCAFVVSGFTADATAAPAVGKSTNPQSSNKKVSLKKTTKRYSARAARARRAKLARARAAVRAREIRDAQTPRFKLDDSGALVPDLRAEAAIIYNPENGQVLWESNSTSKRSIASITKVMTAAVFLENNPDLTERVVVQRADVRNASTTYLRAGYKLSTGDLLHLMLIASDNAAARVLARVSPYGSEEFIDRMNEKAIELGLESTSYADPSGLLADNLSSAYDMAKLITYVSGDERMANIMRTAEYSVAVGRRTITVHSTNQLVMRGDVDVLGGKTGFITKAGYCLATLLRLPQGGPQVAVVVLGAKSNAGRFWETRHLFNWLSGKAQEVFGTAKPEAQQ